jgi:hypothetical protein
VRKADNLTDICEPIIQKIWEPRRLTTLWASTACYRDSVTFILDVPERRIVCVYEVSLFYSVTQIGSMDTYIRFLQHVLAH